MGQVQAGAQSGVHPGGQPAGGGYRRVQDRRAVAKRAAPGSARASAAERRTKGGVACSTGRLGGAAGFLFSEQFFPAAEAGRSGARAVGRERDATSGGCVLRSWFLQHRTGRPGRVIRGGGIGPIGDSSRAPERVGARAEEWRIRGGGGGGGMAGGAAGTQAGGGKGDFGFAAARGAARPGGGSIAGVPEAIPERGDNGSAGSAAQRMSARALGNAAPGAAFPRARAD